jgi:hypothetical protein
MRSVSVTLMLVCLAGCAGVNVSDDSHVDSAPSDVEEGLRFYPSKPYLLLMRTGSKDKPVEMQIVSLPDFSHPQRMHLHRGPGSADYNFGFDKGTLTTFRQQTDSKIPETITAISGLLKAVTDPGKLLAAASSMGPEGLEAVGEKLEKDVLPWLKDGWKSAKGCPAPPDTMAEAAQQLQVIISKLKESPSDKDARNFIAGLISDLVSWLDKVRIRDVNKNVTEVEFNGQVLKQMTNIRAITLGVEIPDKSFQLFEFVFENKVLSLKEVNSELAKPK